MCQPLATLVLFRASVIQLPQFVTHCNKLLHDIILAAHRPITTLEMNPTTFAHVEELFKVSYPDAKQNSSQFLGLASSPRSTLPQKRMGQPQYQKTHTHGHWHIQLQKLTELWFGQGHSLSGRMGPPEAAHALQHTGDGATLQIDGP